MEYFDIIYKYFDEQIEDKNFLYISDSYELYLRNNTEILFKKDGYTLAKVTKEQDIVSLAKRKKDNDIILKEINQIFCKILSASKEKK